MAFVVLKNRFGENPAAFSNSFTNPLEFGPGRFSKVALKSLAIDTLPDLEITTDMTLSFVAKKTGVLPIPIAMPIGSYASLDAVATALQDAVNDSMLVVPKVLPVLSNSSRLGISHLVSTIPVGGSTGRGFRIDCCITPSSTKQTYALGNALVGGMTFPAGTLTRTAAAGSWEEWATGDLVASRGSYRCQAKVKTGTQYFSMMPSRPVASSTATLAPEEVATQGGIAVVFTDGAAYRVFTPDITGGVDVDPGVFGNGATNDIIVFERDIGITTMKIVRGAGATDIGVWQHEPTPWLTVSGIYSASGTQSDLGVTDDIVGHPPTAGGYETLLGAVYPSKRTYNLSRPLATLMGFTALAKSTSYLGTTTITSDNPAQGVADSGALAVKLPDLPIQGRSGITRASEAFIDIIPQPETSTSGRLIYSASELVYQDIVFAKATTLNTLRVRVEGLDGTLLPCEGNCVAVLHFV